MSRFWLYFRNTLRFPYLAAGSAIASFIQAVAAVLDTASESILWLRLQFIASACEEQHLQYFAKSRGIIRYPFETDEQYRVRIIHAFVFYSRAGKDAGIKEVFELYGIKIEIQSLRLESPDRWAEFRCLFPEFEGNRIYDVDRYVSIINDIKPARSKLANIRFRADVDTHIYILGLSKTKTRCIIQPEE